MSLGIRERSVPEIEVEPVIRSLDDATERARRSIGRPSKVERMPTTSAPNASRPERCSFAFTRPLNGTGT